jgi:L-ascorbate metabolism protein UlaG (beta-lactamase superfamily)
MKITWLGHAALKIEGSKIVFSEVIILRPGEFIEL